jgi:hypothetical protein
MPHRGGRYCGSAFSSASPQAEASRETDLHHAATTPAQDANIDLATLRVGDRILVDGRPAVFIYLREPGAVIRYEGEAQTRVVSARKLRLAGEPAAR